MKKILLFLTLFLTMLTFGTRAQVPVFTEGFEGGVIPAGWTTFDADNDGHGWEHSSIQGDLDGHSGTGAMVSYSYDNATDDVLYPNNWLVSPAIALSGTSTLTYWFVVAQSWPADHYGVYVSTTSATDLSSFTLLFEETPTSSHYTWTMRTVDLSSYAGNTVYIAFRHFNCSDNYIIALDDITVSSGTSEPVLFANPAVVDFNYLEINTLSAVQTVEVITSNLSSAIVASVSSPFEVSTDSVTFSSSATLPAAGGLLYLRFAPTAVGAYSDSVVLTSGSTTQSILLSGQCYDCDNVTMPLTQSFESGGGLSCWLAGNGSPDNPNTVSLSSMYASDGLRSLRFSSYSESTDYSQFLVTPMLPVSNTKMVSFDYRGTIYANETFAVGYSTTTSYTNAFVWMDTVTTDNLASGWEHYIVENIPGDAKYIAIHYLSDYQYYLFVDNFLVQEAPACTAPDSLAVTDVTTNSATLNWVGSSSAFNLYYKAATDNDWTVVSNVTAGPTGYLLSGLNIATAYQWKVTSVCDDGSESTAALSSFNTECGAFVVTDNDPWIEPFTASPACWEFPVNAYESFSWISGYIGHDFGNYEIDAISPVLDITAVTTPYLKFDQKRPVYFTVDQLSVYYRSTAEDADTSWMLLKTYTEAANNWMFDSLPLPLNQTTIQLRFHVNGDNNADGCFIDNVSVYNEENAPSCLPPSGLNAVNVTSSSAALSWIMSDGGTLNLYYKPASDTGYTLVENVTLTDGVYTLGNLSSATQYQWYLAVVCGDGTTFNSSESGFVTQCEAFNVPYFQDFEDYVSGENPLCWTSLNPYAGFPSVTTSSSYEGSKGMMFENDFAHNTPEYAVLPSFDADLNTLQVSFWCRREGSNSGTFSVGYLTDPANDSTFTTVWSIDGPTIGDNAYHNYTVRFDSIALVAGTDARIAFRYVCGNNWYWYLDNVNVMAIPNCASPENLAVAHTNTTSVDLTWTGDADSYTLFYKVATDTAYTTVPNVTLGADTLYTLGNLVPGTHYSWYVASNCADGSLAESYNFGVFNTECMEIAAIPVTWTFEGDNFGGNSSNPLPMCWYRSGNSGTYPYVNTGSAYNGDKKLYFYNNNSSAYAVLPAFDDNVLDLQTLQLSFYAKLSNSGYVVQLEVGVMTDPAEESTFTAVGQVELTSDYVFYEIPLNTYTGSGRYVAFHINNNGSSAYSYTYVDNVTLEAIPACSRPQSLTADPDMTSATLSWNSTATSFNVYYKESVDTVWQSVNGVSLDNNGEYELTGLTPATAYDWYVQTACNAGEELSSDVAHFFTSMAAAALPYQTTFATANDWILNNGDCTNYWVAGVPSGETESALFVTNNGTSATYTNTSATVVMAEKLFTMPAADSVHVEFDVLLNGEGAFTPYDYVKVFLAPTSEIYTPSTTGTNVQSPYSYSTYALDFGPYKSLTGGSGSYPYVLHLTQGNVIHVDANMAVPGTNGNAKVVFLWRNDVSGGSNPGAVIRNFSIREVTDTVVVVTEPTVVTEPVSDITQTTATLNGAVTNPDNVTLTAMGFEWKTASASEYTTVNVSGNTLTHHLTGLTAATAYTCRAFITFNGVTVYGDPVSFTTLPGETPEPCDAPTELRETGLIVDKAVGVISVEWTDHAGASQWNLQYRRQGTEEWNTKVVTGMPSCTFSDDVEGGVTYELRVQAVCDNETVSEWSNVLTTVAQSVGIESRLENSVALFPNPANTMLNVQWAMGHEDATIELLDVYGKLLQTIPVAGEITTVNVSGLADGMYFVRVTTGGGVVTKPFVKR